MYVAVKGGEQRSRPPIGYWPTNGAAISRYLKP